MLFGVKLNSEIHGPWKKHYIAYDHLKKLLRENVIVDNKKDSWTEEDESRFVEELDKELEKVYSFETEVYQELSDKLSTVEAKAEDPKASIDPKQIESQLEEILDEAKALDQFRRVNFTGFSKIVKKHDRLHPQYQVRPLLHVRLQALPFHSEDYSPLLYRLSHMYKFLSENFSGSVSHDAAKSHIGSFGLNHSSGYVTLQFWVYPENLMEVKTKILRRLPILVYNGDEDDGEEANHDPTVTSLYCDSPDFFLYQSQLERKKGSDAQPTSLRFRWYGPLYQRPEIVLEQHDEEDGRITRINIKEKQISDFLNGNKSVITKNVQKLKQKGTSQRAVDDYESAATELFDFIQENNIQPILRTVYKRSAFEIPGDDRVRVILDSEIQFIREDALNKAHPIRDPQKWHREDLDQPNVNIKSLLRQGESAEFPFSVLEVRLKQKEDTKTLEKLAWVEELKSSGLIKEIPRFTKYLQGVATLYGEDDRLPTLPFWLSDLVRDVPVDAKLQTSSIKALPSKDTRVAEMSIEDFSSSDESELDDAAESQAESPVPQPPVVGFPTWTRTSSRLEDADSEDEELVLPPGVVRPQTWIKNQSAVKVEAKVWLANERTFNKWLHITCLMSALTFTLYSSVSKASSPEIGEVVAYILFALTLFTGLWGFYQYHTRMDAIQARENVHFDNPIGPLVVSVGLLVALVVNFLAHYNTHKTPTILGLLLDKAPTVMP